MWRVGRIEGPGYTSRKRGNALVSQMLTATNKALRNVFAFESPYASVSPTLNTPLIVYLEV